MDLVNLFKRKDTNELTIIEALAKIKSLNDRIIKETRGGKFYTLSNEQEGTKKASERLQSIQDKISLLGRLKVAVSVSNCNTDIVIAGVTMKVIEAVTLRDTLMQYITRLNSKLSDNFVTLEGSIKDSIDHAGSIAGERNGDELKDFINVMKLSNIDDLDIQATIEEYDTLLEDLLDIENKLNISNVTTIITV